MKRELAIARREPGTGRRSVGISRPARGAGCPTRSGISRRTSTLAYAASGGAPVRFSAARSVAGKPTDSIFKRPFPSVPTASHSAPVRRG